MNIYALSRRSFVFGLTAALTTACGVRRATQGPSSLPVKSGPLTPAAFTRVVQSFPDLASALSLALEGRPPIAAFGEIHKLDNTTLQSTLELFARAVPPLLVRNGYHDLILEHLPAGQNITQEITQYNKTGKIGPNLNEALNLNPDSCGLLAIIEQARIFNITLHGIHAETTEEYWHLQANGEMGRVINERFIAKIKGFLARGEKIATYSGMQHNSLIPLPGRENLNFGRLFVDRGLKEIDIIHANLLSEAAPEELDCAVCNNLLPTETALIQEPNG
ncbi:MAG: hypothetical protein ABIH56_03300, partial [Candidatus Margulisiibacteriota bacterium]